MYTGLSHLECKEGEQGRMPKRCSGGEQQIQDWFCIVRSTHNEVRRVRISSDPVPFGVDSKKLWLRVAPKPSHAYRK